jgi:hypothetical protein
VVLQRVDQRAGDARAGHAERVSDGDGTAVDIQLVDRDAELLGRPQCLHRERLVDLEQVDVIDRHARVVQGLTGGLHRSESHDLRREPGDSGRDDAGERREAELPRLRVAHDDHGGGSIVEGAAVAGRDCAVRAEHRLQL